MTRQALTAAKRFLLYSMPLFGLPTSATAWSPLPTTLSVSPQTAPIASSKEDTPRTDDQPITTITINAAYLDQHTDHPLAQTSVFDTQTIAASQAIDLAALLPFATGAQIVRNGSIGAANSFYLRGASSTQILFLLDGVRIDSASLGNAQLSQLMLDDVARVEVVNGNVSALYGSHAIGGVVQIFTKQAHPSSSNPQKAQQNAEVSTQYGSYQTQRLHAAWHGSLDAIGDTTFYLGYTRFLTDGFAALNPDKIPQTQKPLSNAHGFSNTHLNLAVQHQINPDWYAGLRLYNAEGVFNFSQADGLPTDINRADNRLRLFSALLHGQLNASWFTRLIAAQSQDQSTHFLNQHANGRFYTTNDQLSWQNEFTLSATQKTVFGYEHLTQRLDSDMYAAPSRVTHSIFAGQQAELGRHQFQFHLRRDQYTDFGTAHSYYAGYGYALNQQWQLSTSLSNAFRAPAFNDLYYPHYGNPALRPERSHSAEVALAYTSPDLGTLRITAFQTYYRDLIESVQIKPGRYQAQNVGRAKIQGLEASLESQIRQNQIRLTATIQNPVDQKRATILPRRPRHFAALSIARPYPNGHIGVQWLVSGARDDSGTPLGGYGLVNLNTRYNLNRAWYIAARLDNLFNKQYELAYAYQTPARSAYIMLGWQPHAESVQSLPKGPLLGEERRTKNEMVLRP